MRRAGLYTLFFLSGVTGLTYELTWQRLLQLVFGVSTLSVSAVLAAFMGGLALGGLLFGRLADRTGRPWTCYAWLEAGIGLAGMLVPPGFALLATVYTSLYTTLAPGPWAGACLRFGMALVILAVPATLLGGTVPVMSRLALRRDTTLPTTFSLLYAVNTLGAVLGAALTGLLLLRFVGMRHTLWMAAGLNLAVALAAALACRWQRNSGDTATGNVHVSRSSDGTRAQNVNSAWLALGCAGLLGLVAMGLEVLWMRVLGILTSNSAYGFALMLTVLLLGLGLGSLLQWGWCHIPGNPWRRLTVCQWLLAGLSLATIPIFHTTPGWLQEWCNTGTVRDVFLGELALTAALVCLPAVLMGMSLPLLVAGVTRESAHFGKAVGRIYAANAVGGVVGAAVTGLLLIPRLGIHGTLGCLTAGTLLVAAAAGLPGTRRTRLVRFAVAGVVLLAAGGLWKRQPVEHYLKSPVLEPRQLLYYREGDSGTVSVVEEANGTRLLMVDGQPVAGTSSSSVIDQKMLAHLPLLLHPDPHRALTVGFGSGGTSYSMTLHGIDVDCVEIERAVPGAAEHFRSENHGVLDHPHFRLIVDDARSWLRVAPVRYDAIVTDCTNIQYRSNGDLYTVDYFRLMKRRLTPDGIAAAWVPTNGIEDRDLKTLVRSFHRVFPHTSVWFMNSMPTDFVILVGTPGVLDIDLDRLRQGMSRPGVAEDLEEVGLTDPARLAYTFLTGEEGVERYLGAGPLNTDDRPVLSYSTYGATFRPTAAGNLLRLLACRGDVGRFVRHPADTETMLRQYAASNDLALGHIACLVGSSRAALGYYLESCRLLPGDAALRMLLRSAYLSLK